MTMLELALNGIGMRVFMAVIASSSIQALFDTQVGGAGAMALTAFVVNIVFLMVAITMPFLVHSIVHGSFVSAALVLPTWQTAKTVKNASQQLAFNAMKTKAHLAKLFLRVPGK